MLALPENVVKCEDKKKHTREDIEVWLFEYVSRARQGGPAVQ
jgi:hypothetical protein